MEGKERGRGEKVSMRENGHEGKQEGEGARGEMGG